MNELLDRLHRRYGLLSRRQRLMAVVAALVLIGGLGELTLVEPALVERQRLLEVVATESAAREQREQRLVALQQPHANLALRAQLATLQAQLAGTDKEFDTLQSGLMQPQQMGALLQSLLSEQRGLQLLGLRSLPVTAVTALDDGAPARKGAAAAPAPLASAGASAVPNLNAGANTNANANASVAAGAGSGSDGWLYRHAVEVRVRGSYADMVGYLEAIESFPRRVHWGELEIDSSNYPANVMTVTIYTVSLERSWWVL